MSFFCEVGIIDDIHEVEANEPTRRCKRCGLTFCGLHGDLDDRICQLCIAAEVGP